VKNVHGQVTVFRCSKRWERMWNQYLQFSHPTSCERRTWALEFDVHVTMHRDKFLIIN